MSGATKFPSRRPDADEFSLEGHRDLIARVAGGCVLEVLNGQLFWLNKIANSLSTEQVDRLHPPYQWTVRQVVEHCCDAERIFGARMLRIAAGDRTELASWDENAYAASRFGLGNFGHLVSELTHLRQANVLLLRRLTPRCWDHRGSVNGQPISVRALAWVAAGHLQHHLQIVEQRCALTPEGEPTRAE